ncbi:hypothetical protein CC78DRAFT_538760 [Lojkania enalia]|uniref:Uncharacterized protein n=1 Tax=Lojkania enalia TaxID=147567 RepID=A0A9P4ND39_9PLEO|nr:hypothetical protein CC78DRAFT_538760 [Didymosphaeria enalia]
MGTRPAPVVAVRMGESEGNKSVRRINVSTHEEAGEGVNAHAPVQHESRTIENHRCPRATCHCAADTESDKGSTYRDRIPAAALAAASAVIVVFAVALAAALTVRLRASCTSVSAPTRDGSLGGA